MDESWVMMGLLAMPRYLAAALMFWCGARLFQRLCGLDIQGEVVARGNPAAAAWWAGHLVGLGMALRGAMFGGGYDLVADLLSLLLGGGLALVLLPSGSWLIDRFVLPTFDARVEIARDRNVGTGVVLAASAIGTGLVLDGALTGHSESWQLGLRDILLYFVASQAFMVVGGLVYAKVAPFEVHDAIEKRDSAAAGYGLAGFLLGMGIVTRAAISGASSDLAHELLVLAVDGALGVLVLAASAPIVSALVLRASLREQIGEQHNPASGLVVGCVHVASALLLAGALRPF